MKLIRRHLDLIYIPATLLWVLFVVSFKLANLIVKNPRYMTWSWLGVKVADTGTIKRTKAGDK